MALTPETRCPAIVLGCGEARTNLAERWSICDWDPVRFAVCLTDDDPVANSLTAEGSAVVTLAPTDKSGPSWRGHAGAARPLGHLLMQLETSVHGEHETVHILRVQDAGRAGCR